MGASALLDLDKPLHPFLPRRATGNVYDPATGKNVKAYSEPPKGYFLHVRQRSSRDRGETPTVERGELLLQCRIVRSPNGKPLTLPPGVTSEHQFPLTLRGKPGLARLEVEPDDSIKEVQDELGQKFSARFNYDG